MNDEKRYSVMQINTVYPYGSTGKIAKGIQDICQGAGINNIVVYRYRESKHQEPVDSMVTSSWLDCHVHNRISRYTLLQGYLSYFRTKRFLKMIERPDIIHLHNLHGSYINLRLLFLYIKKHKISVVWTLHDCWPFTGYCPHYVSHSCMKWQSGCNLCEYYKPKIKLHKDIIAKMWRDKKHWFTGTDAVFVTPSKWLADQVSQSFLKNYPVKVINNGIDLTVFVPNESSFRQKYHCESKMIVLGVAMGWSDKKGFDVFVELASRLPDDYQIVLVGGNEQTDNKLPANVLSIHRTQNQHELAEIYSVADVFVNPTREDTFPTVNIESLACGTPVVTFRTGGSPECIDETCGSVVECDDIDALEHEIIRICKDKPYSQEACIKRARQFDQKDKFKEYVKLYEDMAHNK